MDRCCVMISSGELRGAFTVMTVWRRHHDCDVGLLWVKHGGKRGGESAVVKAPSRKHDGDRNSGPSSGRLWFAGGACALRRTRLGIVPAGLAGVIDTPVDFWRIEQVYV